MVMTEAGSSFSCETIINEKANNSSSTMEIDETVNAGPSNRSTNSGNDANISKINLEPSFSTSLLEKLRPHPKIKPKAKTSRGRKTGSSKIYTDTPEKDRIEQLVIAKEEKKRVEEQRKKELKSRSSLKRILVPEIDNAMKRSNKHQSSSSSESDIEVNVANSSDSDFILEEEKEDEILKICESDVLEVNNFVLVEFKLQKSKVHYVGRIERKINEKEYEIFFFRSKGRNKFSQPDVDDISTVERADIVALLPQPLFCVGTARSTATITFQISFASYNIR